MKYLESTFVLQHLYLTSNIKTLPLKDRLKIIPIKRSIGWAVFSPFTTTLSISEIMMISSSKNDIKWTIININMNEKVKNNDKTYQIYKFIYFNISIVMEAYKIYP